MTIEEMKARKQELGYSNLVISQRSGVPLGTVQKIFAGITKSPRRETIAALEKLLQVPLYSQPGGFEGAGEARTSIVMDEAVKYASSSRDAGRKYTIDDYYALPDERRVELIDGVFYDMAAPTMRHQAILGALYLQFARCVEEHPECRVYFAPLDVRLDKDQWTMLQPDLLIVCGGGADDRFYDGAPDFVAEVLSPSTRSKDMFLKLVKYKTAGVREYWIIDPSNEKIIAYTLETEDIPTVYTFESEVPVAISSGECSIDFREVKRCARM